MKEDGRGYHRYRQGEARVGPLRQERDQRDENDGEGEFQQYMRFAQHLHIGEYIRVAGDHSDRALGDQPAGARKKTGDNGERYESNEPAKLEKTDHVKSDAREN